MPLLHVEAALLLVGWMDIDRQTCCTSAVHQGSVTWGSTHRSTRHAADDEVASASQDRLRHEAVVRRVLGACNEATGLLRGHDGCL